MMNAAVASFEGREIAGACGEASGLRLIMRALARRLERLLPPRRRAGQTELPPEFFKYPPV